MEISGVRKSFQFATAFIQNSHSAGIQTKSWQNCFHKSFGLAAWIIPQSEGRTFGKQYKCSGLKEQAFGGNVVHITSIAQLNVHQIQVAGRKVPQFHIITSSREWIKQNFIENPASYLGGIGPCHSKRFRRG